MLGGMHRISNASSIFLFNILYVFAFIKMIYFECQNKKREKKQGTRENNNKKNFSCGCRFCNTIIKKQWPKTISGKQ